MMAKWDRVSYNDPQFAYWADVYEDEDELCPRCAEIDSKSMFQRVTGFQHHIATLGRLGPTAANSSCPACRFFFAMKNVHSEDGIDDDAEYILWNIPPSPTWEYIDYRIREFAGSILAVVDQTIEPDDVYWEVHSDKKHRNKCIGSASVFFEQKVGRICRDYPKPFASRRISATDIDGHTMHDWLQLCREHHWDSCEIGRLNDIKLIDCVDGSIVHFGETVPPYFALSYVWGLPSSTNNHLAISGKLPKVLPRTIEDAITVTKAYGFKYLWIDRYCIDQNKPEEVRTQVNKMDEIYKGADVTIVAAAGSGPDHGLPGVGETPRKPQPAVRIGQHLLVSIMTDTTQLVEDAIWNTRGWTFQEGFLANRRLIFTDQQLYWDCRGARGLESVQGFYSQAYFTKEKNFLTAAEPSLFANQEESEDFENIWPLLTRFTRRKLTSSSDAIRAFRGILNHYTKLSGTFKYGDEVERMTEYMGIPIIHHSTVRQFPDPEDPIDRKIQGFLAGLCWVNATHGPRRQEFPSWSWAGWGVELLNEIPEAVENGFHSLSGEPTQVVAEALDGQLKEWRLESCFEYCMAHPDEYSRFIHIKGWTIDNLNIQYMPEEARGWTSSFLQDDQKWNKGKNISGYFAVFKDSSCAVHLPLYSLHQTYDEKSGEPAGFMPDSNGGDIIGLVLGRCEDYSPLIDVPRGKGETVMILLLQDKGGYYERVGHARFEMGNMRLDPPPPENKFIGTNPWPPAKLVFERKKRRTIRIG